MLFALLYLYLLILISSTNSFHRASRLWFRSFLVIWYNKYSTKYAAKNYKSMWGTFRIISFTCDDYSGIILYRTLQFSTFEQCACFFNYCWNENYGKHHDRNAKCARYWAYVWVSQRNWQINTEVENLKLWFFICDVFANFFNKSKLLIRRSITCWVFYSRTSI